MFASQTLAPPHRKKEKSWTLIFTKEIVCFHLFDWEEFGVIYLISKFGKA